ncbi:MAG: FimV/HubP family polar landmark protein [Mizugakiibacter sp.]|uniref:FimV/HubP family polar landmark protein n=1 Tax=Mizugakiibacter sp. TaxID=1972610 RepID=UPI0031C0AE12|nr:fimbrial protein FimV [Xanthomonadaceae bacterium]
MKRSYKLPMAVAFALTLGSTQALALGLGQIQVKSALNQPLVAEIPVIVDSPAEAEGLQVALASDEDFSRIGLSRGNLNVPIDFAVGTDAQGRAVIRVTSKDAVRDPYLDFLVQVNWAKGRLLREYTVLLDPVVAPSRGVVAAPARSAAAASRPAPEAAPAAAAPAPAPAAERAAASAAPSTVGAASPGAGAPSAAGSGSYEVKAGDTLWEIANTHRPGSGIDVNQMMLALLKANPDAFYKDNVNTMKRGAILRIPGRDQIAEAGSAEAAAAEIHRQFEDWRGSTAQKPTVVAAEAGTAASRPAPAVAKPAAGDRLRLVPPEEGGTSANTRAGVAGGTEAAAVNGLRQGLARAKETLAAQQQEADELKARLKESEDLNSKNQRLLSLKDAEIAELQRKLAEVQKQAGAPAAAPRPVQPVPAPVAAAPKPAATVATASAAASTAAKPASASSVAGATPAAAASAAARKPVESVPTQAKPVSTTKPLPPAAAPRTEPLGEEIPWWNRQDLLLPAGGVVAVGLVLFGLLRLRRRPKPEPAASGISSRFGDSPLADEQPVDTAYGEEEDSLLSQLAEHPDDIGLHLELASLYYAHRDVERFEAAAEAMHAHVADPGQPEWQEVHAMGEELAPQHPLFAPAGAPHADEAPASAHDDESGALESFDLGQYADEAPAAAAAARSSEYSFDFDLTPHASPAEPAAQAPVGGEEADFGLPALDLGDELPAAAPPAEPSHAAPGELEALPAFDLGDLGQAPAPQGAAAAAPSAGYGDDPVDTKLDLARAYLDMGDPDGARAMLEEVLAEGSAKQKSEAQKLLGEIG